MFVRSRIRRRYNIHTLAIPPMNILIVVLVRLFLSIKKPITEEKTKIWRQQEQTVSYNNRHNFI